jgi:hypothetical protein
MCLNRVEIMKLNQDALQSSSILGLIHVWPVRENTYPRQRCYLLSSRTGVCPRLIRMAGPLQQLELVVVTGPSHRLSTFSRRHGLEPGNPWPPCC